MAHIAKLLCSLGNAKREKTKRKRGKKRGNNDRKKVARAGFEPAVY